MFDKYLILDLETTGLSPQKGDTIIDIGAIICDKNGIIKTFQTLVSPGDVEVSDFVYKLTSISREMLSTAPSLSSALAELREFLGEEEYPIIGHNISFDAGFLNYYGFNFKKETYIDTNDFATIFFPKVSSHSLEVLSSELGIAHEEKHRALGDVLATYGLLKKLLYSYSKSTQLQKELIEQYLSQSTWGGKLFFELPYLPSSEDELVVVKEAATSPTSTFLHEKGEVLARTLKKRLQDDSCAFFALPFCFDTAGLILSACKEHKMHTLLLGGNNDIECFKSKLNSDVLYLDKHTVLFCKSALYEQLTMGKALDEHFLLVLRDIFGQMKGNVISSSTLALTYREKNILSSLKKGIETQELENYISSFPIVIASYAFCLHSSYKSLLLARKHKIILGAMAQEVNILDTVRKTLSLDTCRYLLQKASNSATEELCKNILDVFSLSFETIAKLLKQREKIEDQLFSYSEQIKDLVVYFGRFKEAIMKCSEHESVLEYIEQIELLLKEFSMQDEDKFKYVKSYNNQVTLFSEPRDLSDIREELQKDSTIVVIDSLFIEDYPYFITPNVYYGLEESEILPALKEKLRVNLPTEVSSLKMLEKEESQYLMTQLQNNEKSIVLCNTGAKLEKLFDSILAEQKFATCACVASGKSGGFHKVLYQYVNAASAIFLTKQQDFLQLPSSIQIDKLILQSLPFPNIQGMYFSAKNMQTFFALTLPSTRKQLFDVLCKATLFTTSKNEKVEIFFADIRMFTKDYGKEIIQPYIE